MGTRSESARESSPSRRKGPRFRKLTVMAAALWASTTTPADGFGLPAAFVGSNSNRNRRYQHGQNTATKTATSTATATTTTTTTNRCGRFSEEGNPCLSRRTCLEGPRLLLSRDNSMEGEQRQDDYDNDGSDNGSDNMYGFPTDAEPDPVRLAIHQRLQNEDPDWYHEYVSEILGDDYCQTRWPRASSSTVSSSTVSSSTDLPSIDLQQNIGENDIDNSNNIDENDIDNNNNIDEAELAATATIQSSENSDSDPDPVVVSVSEVDEPEESALPKVEMESESDSDPDLSSRKEKPTTLDGLDVTMPTTTMPTATTKTTATAVDPVASANFASESEISGVPKTAPTVETMSNETATASNANTNANANANTNTNTNTNTTADPRAVLYRNITGNAMTCVPLQDLLDLGYSAPDLERMQSEFLSIVVLDSKTCPSMGVPVQWKVREPSAPPQVTVVDSLEEATAMAASINDQERAEAESKQRRRVRQNDRQKQPEQQSRGRGRRTPEDSKPRETDTDRRSSPRRRQPPAQTQTKRRGPQPSEDENEYENEETGANPRSRRKPRPRRSSRRDALDGDGNPKRIYSVPRAVAEQTVMEDPPDIDSPVWVNIDTFRNLLQKESDLRKMFLGEDWDRTIEQENEWRTDLYKKWLWSLHNGVGGSIVPPTRTERARKLRGPPPPPRERRRRERTPEDRPQRTRRSQQQQQQQQDPQQQRRRRPRGEDPPEPTRRSKRRQSPTGGTAFDNDNDSDDDNDGGARPPVSRRRSRLDP